MSILAQWLLTCGVGPKAVVPRIIKDKRIFLFIFSNMFLMFCPRYSYLFVVKHKNLFFAISGTINVLYILQLNN